MNPTLWLVASLIGTTVLISLALIYRRAASARSLELADELLSETIDAAARRQRRRAGTPATDEE